MDFERNRMDFQEADRRYPELKRQRDMGAISAEAFDAQLRELMVQDQQGHWWGKDRETGEWMYHDGNAWVRETSPGYPQATPGYQQSTPGYQQSAPDYQQGNYGTQPSYGPGGQVTTSAGGVPAGLWIGLGIACAVIALIILPIVFGPLGILFGYLAMRAGNQIGGIAVMVGSGVCMFIGFLIGFVLFL